MTAEIYKEHILDLYKNPQNKKILNNFTSEFSKNNLICGDTIQVQLLIQKEKIKDIGFSGDGCAISQASASLLTDKIKNMSIKQIKNLTKEDVLELLKIPSSYARLNCALLPLDAIKGALENAGN